MRNNLATVLGAILLVSCASAPAKNQTSLSYREQLDIYREMKIRLYQVATPIKAAGIGLCTKAGIGNLFVTHRLSDYPTPMHPIARAYWSLGEGDKIISKIKYDKETVICSAPLVLEYDQQPNAWTDGESIFVTASLLNEVDDLALALIIAHELGHVVLEHVDQEQSGKLERDADRFALFMLARAGLDYEKAAKQKSASRRPHSLKKGAYPEYTDRATHFNKIVFEIEKLQADGKELVP